MAVIHQGKAFRVEKNDTTQTARAAVNPAPGKLNHNVENKLNAGLCNGGEIWEKHKRKGEEKNRWSKPKNKGQFHTDDSLRDLPLDHVKAISSEVKNLKQSFC